MRYLSAVKCNPNRAVVRVLATTPGCGFDCASPAEMDQVLECGADPARIIYANPCKDLAALEHALSGEHRMPPLLLCPPRLRWCKNTKQQQPAHHHRDLTVTISSFFSHFSLQYFCYLPDTSLFCFAVCALNTTSVAPRVLICFVLILFCFGRGRAAGIVTMTFDSKDELHKIRRLLDAREKASWYT